MTREIFDAYRADGWHMFKLIKARNGDGNAVKGRYKTPSGWNDPSITCDYHEKWVYGGVPPADMVAIDWDVKNGTKHGDKSFAQLQQDLGIAIDTIVSTPSGGGHAYVYLAGLPEETPKLKKTQAKYPDIEFQSHASEFVVLGGQMVEGYGEYKFTDEDFEYFVNHPIDFSALEFRKVRVQGDGYTSVDVFEHLSSRPSVDEVKEMLSRISADCDHDGGWQTVGMALNSWDLNGADGEKLFVDWSLTSKKYVDAHGKDTVRDGAIAKYNACVADSPAFYNKLFTLANSNSEHSFDDEIAHAETFEALNAVAIKIQGVRIKNTKREGFIEKLSAKCKTLTGKPERVHWKKEVKYLDREKAKERQDAAKETGLPDFIHTDKGVKYLTTYANLKAFVEHHSEYALAYDIILKRLIVNGNYDVLTGEQTLTHSNLHDELMRFGIPVTIMQHFDAVAFSCAVNPLLTHIENLEPWDGETDYIGMVANTLTTEKADPDYKRAVMESFAIQAIAAWDGKERTAHPLSRLESVMTFVGKQGGGKTTWVGRLMPRFMQYYFKDGVELNPADKDSFIQATNAGLVELGELDATNRKSDISSLKAFLSNLQDEFRLPYGRAAERYKRRTVFVGTVNNPDFLKDATGSRRFLVLDVTSLELPDPDVVEGMWSQAFALYLAGNDWRLPEKYIECRDVLNASFTDIGAAGDTAEEFIRAVDESSGQKQKFSITKILKSLGLQFNARERSDFVASLERGGMTRYDGGKYYLPLDVFSNYKMNLQAEEFEDLDGKDL